MWGSSASSNSSFCVMFLVQELGGLQGTVRLSGLKLDLPTVFWIWTIQLLLCPAGVFCSHQQQNYWKRRGCILQGQRTGSLATWPEECFFLYLHLIFPQSTLMLCRRREQMPPPGDMAMVPRDKLFFNPANVWQLLEQRVSALCDSESCRYNLHLKSPGIKMYKKPPCWQMHGMFLPSVRLSIQK